MSDRKTTRELIVSIAEAHQRYRACKENGLTVVLRIADSRTVEAVYFVRD